MDASTLGTCRHCQQPFTRASFPRVLGCGHLLCDNCCYSDVTGRRRDRDRLRCHECAESTQLVQPGWNGVRQLPVSDIALREAIAAAAVERNLEECAQAEEYDGMNALHMRLLCNDPGIDFMQSAALLHRNFSHFVEALVAAPDTPPQHTECALTWLLMLFSTFLVKAPPLPDDARRALQYDMTVLHRQHPAPEIRVLCENILKLYWDGQPYAA